MWTGMPVPGLVVALQSRTPPGRPGERVEADGGGVAHSGPRHRGRLVGQPRLGMRRAGEDNAPPLLDPTARHVWV